MAVLTAYKLYHPYTYISFIWHLWPLSSLILKCTQEPVFECSTISCPNLILLPIKNPQSQWNNSFGLIPSTAISAAQHLVWLEFGTPPTNLFNFSHLKPLVIFIGFPNASLITCKVFSKSWAFCNRCWGIVLLIPFLEALADLSNSDWLKFRVPTFVISIFYVFSNITNSYSGVIMLYLSIYSLVYCFDHCS